MSEADPRTRGFNYGSPHKSPMPPNYQTAQQIARNLSRQSREIGDEAWTLEMAIRDVRIAVTGGEKALAIQRLEQRLLKYHNLMSV